MLSRIELLMLNDYRPFCPKAACAGRRYLGFELSEAYAQSIEKRLAAIESGDALDGSAEPLITAPNTANGIKLSDRQERLANKRPRFRHKEAAKQNKLPGI